MVEEKSGPRSFDGPSMISEDEYPPSHSRTPASRRIALRSECRAAMRYRPRSAVPHAAANRGLSHGGNGLHAVVHTVSRRGTRMGARSEEHTSELQSLRHLVCR